MSDYLNHNDCGGRWEPIPGWTSHYRCDKCRVMGYRKAASRRYHTAKENIVPYKCKTRGCNNGAVHWTWADWVGSYTPRGRRSRVYECSEHQEKRS